jgi:hypothetical protein
MEKVGAVTQLIHNVSGIRAGMAQEYLESDE